MPLPCHMKIVGKNEGIPSPKTFCQFQLQFAKWLYYNALVIFTFSIIIANKVSVAFTLSFCHLGL
jgi:hypothetical protein